MHHIMQWALGYHLNTCLPSQRNEGSCWTNMRGGIMRALSLAHTVVFSDLGGKRL